MSQLDRSLISSMALFEHMADGELDKILSLSQSRRVDQGQPVFEQGRTAGEFFVLLHGRLKVTCVTAAGQQIVVRMVNPGDLFGFAKALQRSDYPGTATAAVDSLALVWPMPVWDVVVNDHPSLAVNAMQTIGQRLQEAHTRILEMATQDVERRVAHAVLRLAKQSGKREDTGVRIDFPVSRQDIAEMTGTTLHTVSRIFSAWETEGLVEVGRQKILLVDPHGLLLRADGAKKQGV